jgi:hypothetical protein
MRIPALLLFGLVPACLSQAPKKVPIHIDCTCDDQVGELFATALSDAIASSPRYTEATVGEVKRPDGKDPQIVGEA